MAWYVLRVYTGFELAVSQLLVGVEAYVPLVKERHFNRRNRSWSFREYVMFPGYVLVQTDAPEALDRVSRRCLGLMKETDDRYSVVRDSEIDAVRRIETCTEKGFEHPYEVGQIVRFVEGPLKDRQGVVSHLLSDGTLNVLLELFSSKREVRAIPSLIREAFAV